MRRCSIYPKEIANLQWNTTLHTSRWLLLKKKTNTKNKKENNNYCQGCGEIVHCLWECKMVQPLWNSMVSPKIKKSYHMTQQFHFGIYIQKKRNQRLRYFYAHVNSSIIFTATKTQKTLMSTARWTEKQNYINQIPALYLISPKKETNGHMLQHGWTLKTSF